MVVEWDVNLRQGYVMPKWLFYIFINGVWKNLNWKEGENWAHSPPFRPLGAKGRGGPVIILRAFDRGSSVPQKRWCQGNETKGCEAGKQRRVPCRRRTHGKRRRGNGESLVAGESETMQF